VIKSEIAAMSDRSLTALLGFLDYLSAKGLAPKNTVSGRKAAVSKVLGVLDPEEVGDVTAVDLDSAMTRFFNLEGKSYKPESLGVYRSRVNASINDFKSYLESPSTFRAGSNGQKKAKTESTKRTSKDSGAARPEIAPSRLEPVSSPQVNVLPIPIRPDLIVRIHGMPFDLTTAEADKIAAVVRAMAMN
jgi:hypothetical protein